MANNKPNAHRANTPDIFPAPSIKKPCVEETQMNGNILWQNLYRVYADFSDYVEDFNADRAIDRNTRTAGLQDLTEAKLALKSAVYQAQNAMDGVSKVFSWNPDGTEGG